MLDRAPEGSRVELYALLATCARHVAPLGAVLSAVLAEVGLTVRRRLGEEQNWVVAAPGA